MPEGSLPLALRIGSFYISAYLLLRRKDKATLRLDDHKSVARRYDLDICAAETAPATLQMNGHIIYATLQPGL